jgi:sulfite exporter TauE/SafE
MTIALLLGIFSSWHCLGMCGPLFSALLFTSKSGQVSILHFSIYQLSRIFIYSLMGFIPIILGLQYVPVIAQQIISITSGVLILIFTWFSYFKNSKISGTISGGVKKLNARGIKIKNSLRYVMLGAANGLLPCGMVYIALVASIGNMPQLHPALFMLLFGVSTIPVFLILFIIRKTVIGNKLMQKIFKAKTIILTGVAVLLILRGLNLNIPLISPAIDNSSETTSISCCHAPTK